MQAKRHILNQRACQCFPGGVGAAARLEQYFEAPFFVAGGQGPWLTDANGRRFIDLNTGNGANLLGNSPPEVLATLGEALGAGLCCGYDAEVAIQVAEELRELVPCATMVRFCGSGTEATFHAARLARGVTGRPLLLKFEGHFHGVSDSLGYGLTPDPDAPEPSPLAIPIPDSAGIPEALRELVRVLPFNNRQAVERAFAVCPDRVAAVILEPVNYNGGTLLPAPGYLEFLRHITRQHGALLIFDEILSGFRLCPGGMQAHFRVTPDLCTLGKALGGGLPLSAVAGEAEILSHFAPAGAVSHSGTFVAHPLAMRAALAFLKTIRQPGFYDRLLAGSDSLHEGLEALFCRHGLAGRVRGFGARFSLLFGPVNGVQPRCYRDVARQDHALAAAFYTEARAQGVYFKPGWHHGLSAAHDPAVIRETLSRLDLALSRLAASFPESKERLNA